MELVCILVWGVGVLLSLLGNLYAIWCNHYTFPRSKLLMQISKSLQSITSLETTLGGELRMLRMNLHHEIVGITVEFESRSGYFQLLG